MPTLNPKTFPAIIQCMEWCKASSLWAKPITRTHDVGDSISDVQRLTAESVAVGSARDGSEYSLVLRTVENLELHIRLAYSE